MRSPLASSVGALLVTGLLTSYAAAQSAPHDAQLSRQSATDERPSAAPRWTPHTHSRSWPDAAGAMLRAAWVTGWSRPHRALLTTARGEVWLLKGDPDILMAVAAGGDPDALNLEITPLISDAVDERPDIDGAHLELAWPMRPQLDHALPAMGLAPDAQRRRERLGVSGQGVIIGVIDTGIDWTHPDFSGPDGLRIRWLLDFTRPERVGRHPEVESYGGALWDAAELNTALLSQAPEVDSQDLLGHGTHVAAIAAGRDRSGLGAAGMAPDAELIVVKATTSESSLALDDAAVLAGVRFILDRADDLGRPAVINLSLGGHAGPHDGTSDFERALSELTTERDGCVVVAAAGNDGVRAVHAQTTRRPEAEILLRISPYERRWAETSFALMDVWYETTPDEAEVAVELSSPDGRRTGLALPGETASDLSAMSGPMTISHTRTSLNQPTLRRALVLIQEPISGELTPGDYRLTFTGGPPGQKVDAWLAAPGLFNARLAGEVTQDGTLTVPGTARGVVTVGASVTRDQWLARSGGVVESGLKPGAAASFSSLGPTRDGRPKPDLSAPGAVVAAAMSAQADPEISPRSIFARAEQAGVDAVLPGGRHAVFQGTSMATPFASGAAALLLEQDPTRGAEQIADLLRASAAPLPLGTHWGWDRRAGFGLLDPAAAVALGRGEYGLTVSASESAVGVTIDVVEPNGGTQVIVVARDDEGTPTAPGWRPTTRVVVEAGQALVGDPQPYGEHAVTIPISAGSARGVGSVEVSIEGVTLEARPQIAFVDQRASLAAPTSGQLAGGAGCAQAVASRDVAATGLTWPLWMMCLALGRRRPRARS